jgi:hypothetical protein
MERSRRDSCDPGYGQVASSNEHGNKNANSTKRGKFLD